MKLNSSKLLTAVAVICAGAFAAPAAFAQGTFTPGTGTSTNCNVGTSGSSLANKTCSVGTVTANMTAWGFTATTLGSTATAGFRQGAISDWDASGVGVLSGNKETGTGGNHAFDNLTSGCGTTTGSTTVGTVTLSTNNSGCGGSIEALFLDFSATSTKVNLTSVGIGWYNNTDADLSVWAWTGTGGPNMATQTAAGSTTTTGTTAASMAGWTLVSNLDMDMATPQNTNGTLYSSYFLITTYFGAASTSGSTSLTAGNDAFKLDSFTASLCTGTLTGGSTGGTGGAATNGNGATCTPSTGTPEPGSLALAGVALAGAYGIRRRKITVQQ